ncbi:MAG: winged helix-turn-helix domain-containing tetratricopeptide repeat protein [Betaproteobacteria bacterium]
MVNKPSVYVFADFTLDLARGILRNPDRQIELRPKAFNLLAYFLENAGRVIPKDELLEALWPDVIVTDGSLNQCVGEIRRALGDQAATLLRTVPRRGYIFAEGGVDDVNGKPPAGDVPPQVATQRPASPPASTAAHESNRPGPPSVAVLPFTNMGGDAEQEYFADGVVEEITTALGHFRRIFVIARNSAFTYRGPPVDVRTVGRELGVRYLVEGSVRRAGDKLRITAQLIEAETGLQLWAERLDGVVDDVFRFQDRVTNSVIGAIAPRLLTAEVERARGRRHDRMDAYDLYLRALPAVREMTREGNELALDLVDRALELDPNYVVMAALGGWAYTLRVAHNWRVDPDAERRKGLSLARLAIAKGQDDAEALSMAGYTIGFLGEELHDGLNAVERAIDLNPNDAFAFSNRGWLKAYLGQAADSIASFHEAMRLSPRDPTLFRTQAGLSFAHLMNQDFDNAVVAGRRAVEGNPNFVPAHRALAAALALAGQHKEARKAVARLLQLVPDLTVQSFARESLLRHSGNVEVILTGLRGAGLPER